MTSNDFPRIRVFSSESAVQVAKITYLLLQHQSFNKHSGLISFRVDWFDLLAVQRTFKNFLQHHNLKASILQHSVFFMVQLSHPYVTTGKTIALTIWTFVSKVNTLSRFVIAFLPRSKCLPVSWLQLPSSDFGVQEEKICHCFHFFFYLPWNDASTFSSICHEVMGPDAMILVFWMLSFKPAFSLSSFTFLKSL